MAHPTDYLFSWRDERFIRSKADREAYTVKVALIQEAWDKIVRADLADELQMLLDMQAKTTRYDMYDEQAGESL